MNIPILIRLTKLKPVEEEGSWTDERSWMVSAFASRTWANFVIRICMEWKCAHQLSKWMESNRHTLNKLFLLERKNPLLNLQHTSFSVLFWKRRDKSQISTNSYFHCACRQIRLIHFSIETATSQNWACAQRITHFVNSSDDSTISPQPSSSAQWCKHCTMSCRDLSLSPLDAITSWAMKYCTLYWTTMAWCLYHTIGVWSKGCGQ